MTFTDYCSKFEAELNFYSWTNLKLKQRAHARGLIGIICSLSRE